MIPEDNPFVDAPGRDEIWAWGLRNPWRFSFDPATADLYIADVGQAAKEEVNVAAGEAAGVNYGWNVMEGKQCRGGGQNYNMEGFTLPVLDYSHTGGACSVTGGSVYRGNDLPWLRGHYFYADFCAGWVKSFRNDDGVASQQRDWAAAIDPPSFPTSFGVDGLGELYVLGSGSVEAVRAHQEGGVRLRCRWALGPLHWLTWRGASWSGGCGRRPGVARKRIRPGCEQLAAVGSTSRGNPR